MRPNALSPAARAARMAVACVMMLTLAGAIHLAAQQAMQIQGAGATFPYPIYSRWFAEYNRLNPQVQINYSPLGSGEGIFQITNQMVFFGASDAPMSYEQLEEAPGRILHLPTVLGAVVPIYNLPGVKTGLKFNGQVLADLFLGKITQWNHPALAALNPGVTLPDSTVRIVHRSDGSGTTYVWTDYLSKVSAEWGKVVGFATSVIWPLGLGAQGNEGVAASVKLTPGSLGYVELIFAKEGEIPYGSVQNLEGEFVTATAETMTAAAAAAVAAQQMPRDFRVSITNAPGKGVYPISSFTWLLLYQNPGNRAHAKAMVDFLKWALTDGQKYAAQLGYAPLPEAVVKLEMAALARIRVS